MRADAFGGFLCVQNFYRRTPRAPLAAPLLYLFKAGLADSTVQGAVGLQFAVYRVFLNKFAYNKRRCAQQIQQSLAIN
ncbi:hypothetical protein D3C80_1090220 [compost metagenome]